jgi:hypothetical protein
MGRKSKTEQLSESILGQHLALSVAAHLARSQLVPNPLATYDAAHLSEMLDLMARALAKVAPLYAQDPATGQPRELGLAELEGAAIRRGATIVTLKDGRTLSSVSIKRADLRQAIAVLKAVGVQELFPPAKSAAEPGPPAPNRVQDALAQLGEIEALLRPPLVESQIDRANRLAVSMARNAPQGNVANLAMQLMSALHEARGGNGAAESPALIAARLRVALQEAERAKT